LRMSCGFLKRADKANSRHVYFPMIFLSYLTRLWISWADEEDRQVKLHNSSAFPGYSFLCKDRNVNKANEDKRNIG
jgi:hypothetical protein